MKPPPSPTRPAGMPAPPQPIDRFDGVPDAAAPSRRRLPMVLVLFAVWLAFLVYCLLAART